MVKRKRGRPPKKDTRPADNHQPVKAAIPLVIVLFFIVYLFVDVLIYLIVVDFVE